MTFTDKKPPAPRRFEPYPAYRDSGVEWLEEIPVHWEVKPLKYFLRAPLAYGVLKPDKYSGGDGVPLIRILDVESGQVAEEALELISPEQSAEYRRTIVRAGDLVVSVVGTIGRAFVVPNSLEGANLSRALARVQLKPNLSARFLEYGFDSSPFKSFVELVPAGTAQRVLNLGDLAKYQLTSPPPFQQEAIIAYLDRETARIDALVAKEERLIELLQEKRAALITRAVTKGLDPTAPMKDSGVEWLGEIPAHWEVKRLRHVGEAIIGLTYQPDDVVGPEEGVLVLRASNVCDGRVVYDDNVFVRSAIPEHLRTRLGDILICARSGSRNLIGKSARIDASAVGLTFGTFMIVFRSPCNPFLFYVFNSALFEYQSGTFLTSTISQLTVSNLKNMSLPVPPGQEETAIATFLDQETAKLDALVAKIRDAIDRLKELRAALISAAVTGKIDVREL